MPAAAGGDELSCGGKNKLLGSVILQTGFPVKASILGKHAPLSCRSVLTSVVICSAVGCKPGREDDLDRRAFLRKRFQQCKDRNLIAE